MSLYDSMTSEPPPMGHIDRNDDPMRRRLASDLPPPPPMATRHVFGGSRALFEEPKPPSIPNSDSESNDDDECPKIFTRPELRQEIVLYCVFS